MHPVSAHQAALLPHHQDDLSRSFAVLRLAFLALDDVDALEQPHTPNITDEGVLQKLLEPLP